MEKLTKWEKVFEHGAHANASAALHARSVTCQSSAKCTGAVAVVVEISNVLSQNRAEGSFSQSNGQLHSGFAEKQTLWRKQYTNSGTVNTATSYMRRAIETICKHRNKQQNQKLRYPILTDARINVFFGVLESAILAKPLNTYRKKYF